MFDEWEQDFDLMGFKKQKMRFSYWGEIQINKLGDLMEFQEYHTMGFDVVHEQ